MTDLEIVVLAVLFPVGVFGLTWLYAYLRYGPINRDRKARYPVRPW